MELRLFLYLIAMFTFTISDLNEKRSIRTIYGIGRNYVKHAEELNNPVPNQPIIFIKPLSSLCFDADTVLIPELSNDVHHEVELVLSIGKKGKHIAKENALSYIEAAGVGIDFTARDIQGEAAKNGHPWAVAKGFDTFTALSEMKSLSTFDGLNDLLLELKVNDVIKQNDSTSLMIFDIPSIIYHLSKVVTLYPGDLIYTGTPSGVSPIQKGDRIIASLNNDIRLELNVDKE